MNCVGPQTGFVKVNCVAKWDKASKSGATAVCAFGEAQAIRDGIEYATKQGWRRLQVESDSNLLICILQGEAIVPIEIAILVAYIHMMVTGLEVKFQFTRREHNNAAHEVAHWNCGSEQEASWLEVPPHWLISRLIHDCSTVVSSVY
ncbi:hypothetical protein LIER_04314 [Lithospermum erythrorhizon]|uniref:RNase H type-1 domain-containing protein n=1 Tax=Lithospermum erythrorhizon TaxID=34254 RepID=A0AAV3NY82_LITER